MQLFFHPRGSGVEWRKSGSNMEHRYMELESLVEKLFSQVLVPIRCSPITESTVIRTVARVTTRSARRLVNWSSLRPLCTLIKRGGGNSLRAQTGRQIAR